MHSRNGRSRPGRALRFCDAPICSGGIRFVGHGRVAMTVSGLLSSVLFLAVLASPVYVVASGLPQPADMVFLLFAGYLGISLVATSGAICFPGFFKLWASLVFWVCLVALSWAIVDGDYALARPALFWIYNFIVGLAVFQYLRRAEGGEKVLAIAFVGALIVSFVGVVVDLGAGGRVTAWFNNPNQLGYFTLLALATIAVLTRFELRKWWLMLGWLAGGVAAFSAASLAVWGGLVALVGGYLLANVNSLKGAVRMGLVGIMLLMGVVVFDYAGSGVLSAGFESRLDRAPEKIAGIVEERNYDRVVAFPEYWGVGAGEASRSVDRFGEYSGLEVHSSLGMLLLSYGIPALLMFLVMLGVLLKRAPLPVALVIMGVLFYSLTHMGLRFTPFWLFLVVVYFVYVDAPRKIAMGTQNGRGGGRANRAVISNA